MSYSGNMPDWHQYNPPQHGRATTTSGGQNLNSSQLFLSSINPPSLDTINLTTTDRQSKHQRNDVNYPSTRNYPQAGTITNSSSTVHMAPLSSCVNHYGTSPSRNPMMEGMSSAMDPRLGTVNALNDTDLPHRNTQMPFNASTTHTNPSTMSGIHGGMTSQTSPVGPISPSRQASYGACKGPCCVPEPSIAYQHWDKYGHYQSAAYRENMRASAYPIENRRYVPEMNIRKDCHENKELVGSTTFGLNNRRSYQDYKYPKEMVRNYPASGLLSNYPMQHYNFPTDCQKCPHAVKDYLRRGNTNGAGIAPQNPGIIKYPEQQSVIVQQKYNGKPLSYSNGPTVMPNTSASNLPSTLQNSYFNAQIPRDVPRDFSREYQDPSTVNSRLPSSPSSSVQGSYQKYHAYHQKISMQRYSIENHLRAMTRIPGYQSHPKYQEYLMRYRELVRLQQNVDYQGVIHDTAKIQSPSSAPVQPINLQFDQNGVLINSTYNTGHFSMHNTGNATNPNPESAESLDTNPSNVPGNSMESTHHFLKHGDQSLNLSRDVGNILHTNEHHPDRYLMQKSGNNSIESFENLIVDVDELDVSQVMTTAGSTRTTTSMMMENARPFAHKPQLDVRQFLANWDETEEEEAMANLPKDLAIGSTSVIVTDCSSKLSTDQPKVSEKPDESTPKEKSSEVETTVVDANVIVPNSVEHIDVTGLTTIEELANSGTIVQCIQSDTDDIPTIHIVDHLPEDSALSNIQTVYGDVSSLTLEDIAKAPIEIISETPNGTETITLYEADSDVCTKVQVNNEVQGNTIVTPEIISVINTPDDITKPPEEVDEGVNKEKQVPESTAQPERDEYVSQSLTKSQQSVDTSHLKKQHSFPSEEPHNHDDISLPDIPMSECTPISTTLNTPIHSDTEESSEHGEALEMSTNPIEVVQNSPIISFTHSPIKIDPYVNLDNDRLSEKRPHNALNFDFNGEDNGKNKFDVNERTVIEEFEIARNSSDPSDIPSNEKLEKTTEKLPINDSEKEFYPCSDPLVGMGQTSNMISNKNQEHSPVIDISNDIIQAGDFSEALEGNTRPGTPVSRILSSDEIDTGRCPSIIDTEDFQPSDDLDKLCNISLDGSCMMPLMAEDHSEVPRLPDRSMEDRSLTKVIKNVGPISEMDVLESSDEEQLDKDDDAWVEVRSLDEELIADLNANETTNKSQSGSVESSTNQQIHSNELENIFDSPEDVMKTTKYLKSVTSWSEYHKFKTNPPSDNYSVKKGEQSIDKPRSSHLPSIFDISGDSQSTEFDKFERKKQEKLNKVLQKPLSNDKSNDTPERFVRDNSEGQSHETQDNNLPASSNSTLINAKSVALPTKISCNEDVGEQINNRLEDTEIMDGKSTAIHSDELRKSENSDKHTITRTFRRTHKDTDVEIHVAKINVNKKIDEYTEDDGSDAEGAIEIKINVSRSEINRRRYFHEKLAEEVAEMIKKRAFITSHAAPGKVSNQRRLSVSGEVESKRPKRKERHVKRRHSDEHSSKSYYRVEERHTPMDFGDKSQQLGTPSRTSDLLTVSEREVTDREDIDQMNSDEWPISSQNEGQDINSHHSKTSKEVSNETTNDKSTCEDHESRQPEPEQAISVEHSEQISRSNFDEWENVMSRSSFEMTPGPSLSSYNENPWIHTHSRVDSSASMLDFDNFDVAPNESSDTDLPRRNDEDTMQSKMDDETINRRLEDSEKYRNPYAVPKPPGMEALEINLNTVPIYTTKDGKITYSPNPRYTYRALIMEARHREGYPTLKELHYSKSLRDGQDKRLYKHRIESFEKEKRRWPEYNVKRTNPSLPRRRFEDSGRRISRPVDKYDNRRKERPSETDEFTDDRSRLYSESSVPPSYCSTDTTFTSQHYRYYQAIHSRRYSEMCQKDVSVQRNKRKSEEHLHGDRAIESVVDVSSGRMYEQGSENAEAAKIVDAKISNNQEMELFSKNLEFRTVEVPRPENRSSPTKQNVICTEKETSIKVIKWTVPNSLDHPISDDESKGLERMKPPASVDTEQDSQAMLTDSGLESSTTYTEGCKESNRKQKWQSTFIYRSGTTTTKVSTPKSICEEPRGLEPIIDGQKDNHEDSQQNIQTCKLIDQSINSEDVTNSENKPGELDNKEERLLPEKPVKKSIDIEKLTKLFLSTNHMNPLHSSTLDGLDLAYPVRHKAIKISQPTEIHVAPVTKESVENIQNEKSTTPSIFVRQDSTFQGVKKVEETPTRRASSDGVESNRKQSMFYEDISTASSLSIAKSNTIASKSLVQNLPVEESKEMTIVAAVETPMSCDVSRVDANLYRDELPLSCDDKKFEKPEIPMRFLNFGAFNNSAQKPNETTSCDGSTESDRVSHIEDTVSSTQFGSDCANSKTNDSSVAGVPYLYTSSQEAIDASDLNQVRKNLSLCAINDVSEVKDTLATETSSMPIQRIIEVEETGNTDKILNFSGRISSESEDDSNAQHGSPMQLDKVHDLSMKIARNEEKILSFSGQIQSPEMHAQNLSPIRDDPGKLLTFTGRIPSPENHSDNILPKRGDVQREIFSSNLVTHQREVNLTFSGKIQNDLGETVARSPPIMDKIPKFIIKTDGASKSSSISQIFPSDQGSQKSSETKASTSHKIPSHPKIPKMIIRNLKSRPGTPVVEESAVELSFPKSYQTDQKVFEVKIKLDGQTVKHDSEVGRVRKSIGIIECKVPKMKIKLEDKVPKMIFHNASMQLNDNSSDSSKSVPKVKIRKVKRSSSKEDKSVKVPKTFDSSSERFERSTKVEKVKESSSSAKSNESSYRTDINQDNGKQEKIPKLKIKKQETKLPDLSSESSKKKRSKSPVESSQKSQRKSSSSRHKNDIQLVDNENTNSHQSASEKIPKVIIKRASAGAEFKCELSKDGGDSIIRNSKWQPEVKLERFKVLDSIAKEPGRVKLPSKMLDMITREKEQADADKYLKMRHSGRAVSDPIEKRESKSERSNSKGKRRHSEPERERPSKSHKISHERGKLKESKPSSSRRFDDDSDSEVFPRIRKNVLKKLHDESSQEESLYMGPSVFSNISKSNEINQKATSRLSSQECSTEVTKSEFEHTSTISSHKKNSPTNENPIVTVNESADILIVDVKTVNSANTDEAVIKLESSDESQTTIEILPASPDLSQPESEVPVPLEGKRRIANGDMAQLYSEDAIPTQFELELEIVDNSSASFEVHSTPCEETSSERHCSILYSDTKLQKADDSKVCSPEPNPGPSFVYRRRENDREINISCSDLLVKEVLAAKETLKRCLAKSKGETSKMNHAPRPKTAAEKKQGAGYSLVGISDEKESSMDKDRAVFQESCATSLTIARKENSLISMERRYSRSQKNRSSTERREKPCTTFSEGRKREKSPSVDDKNSQESSRLSHQSPVKSLKHTRELSESRDQKSSHPSKKLKSSRFSSATQCTERSRSKGSPSFNRKSDTADDSKHSGHQSYKIPKISRSNESRCELKPKVVEVMPILEPQGPANFDPVERETSRSPPVITKQDSSEINDTSPKKVEEKDGEKMGTIIHQEPEAISFADIVAQMAYHEKATIKHRRYCILCEKWFPSTERHRQHLIGYQHRFTELTQRRTVHTLFMLFTGKPCPRLLPASVVRTDCVPGEPTPLQIAVQDVAISLEKGDKRKTVSEKND